MDVVLIYIEGRLKRTQMMIQYKTIDVNYLKK